MGMATLRAKRINSDNPRSVNAGWLRWSVNHESKSESTLKVFTMSVFAMLDPHDERSFGWGDRLSDPSRLRRPRNRVSIPPTFRVVAIGRVAGSYAPGVRPSIGDPERHRVKESHAPFRISPDEAVGELVFLSMYGFLNSSG